MACILEELKKKLSSQINNTKKSKNYNSPVKGARDKAVARVKELETLRDKVSAIQKTVALTSESGVKRLKDVVLSEEDYKNAGLSYNEIWEYKGVTYTYFKIGDVHTGGFTSNGTDLGYKAKSSSTYENVISKGKLLRREDLKYNPQQSKQYGDPDISSKVRQFNDLPKASITTISKDSKSTPILDTLPNYQAGQKNMTYAGIGSRETPPHILKQMTSIANKLEKQGYKLQTGKTFYNKEEGADKAFSDGTTNKELFRPEDIKIGSKEWQIAEELHPNFKALTKNWNGDVNSNKGVGGAKLMARNTNQIFGAKLDTPVDFVLFYAEETNNPLRPKGGTGQAVEIARRKGIPTINMTNSNWELQLQNVLKNTKETTPKIPIVEDEGVITKGSIVEYKGNTYVVRDISKNGALKLMSSEGTNMPGTPQPNKVQFIKQLPIKTHNNTEYMYDKEKDRLITSKGVVWKTDSAQRQQIVSLFNEFNAKTDKSSKEKTKYELFPNVYANEGQREAIDTLSDFLTDSSETEYILKGRGGTGKTTIVNKVLELAKVSPFEVFFTTESHKATQVIKLANKDSKYADSTYAVFASSLFKRKSKGKIVTRLLTSAPSVIVVDEASMVSDSRIQELRAQAKQIGAKIIYMGDNVQLPPVEKHVAGSPSPIFDTEKHPNVVELSERMRQGVESPILPITDTLANFVENGSKIEFDGINSNKGGGEVVYTRSGPAIVKSFVKDFSENPQSTRYVWYNNATHPNTVQLVKDIRHALYGEKAKSKFVLNEQIILNDNTMASREDGYKGFNSSEYTVLGQSFTDSHTVSYMAFDSRGRPSPQEYTYRGRVRHLDVVNNIDGSKITLSTPMKGMEVLRGIPKAARTEFADIGYAYVISSHKAQGSTYKTVYTDVENILNPKFKANPIDQAKSLYVATSRPTDKLVMINADRYITGKNKQIPSTIDIWSTDTNGYASLSNLAVRPFTFKGKKFYSIEHAYQSLKSGKGLEYEVYNKDWSKGGLVARGTKGTKTDNNWNVDKLMMKLMQESFKQNPEAYQLLLSTGDSVLTHHKGGKIWSKEFPRLLMALRDKNKSTANIESDIVTSSIKKADNGYKYYTAPIIKLDDNQVFVFGSNNRSYNGNPTKGTGGATLVANKQGWIEQKENMANTFSKSGKAYGIQTIEDPFSKPKKLLSKEQIIDNIKQFYQVARSNPNKEFLLAYNHLGNKKSLNGYSGDDLIAMFKEASSMRKVPANIVFSKEWLDAGVTNSVSVEGGVVTIVPKGLTQTQADYAVKQMEADFSNPNIDKQSNVGNHNRQSAIVYGPLDYTYYGGKKTHKAKSMPRWLEKLARQTERALDKPEGYYNHVLFNKFAEGEGIGNHLDGASPKNKKNGTMNMSEDEAIYYPKIDDSIVDTAKQAGAVAIYSIGSTSKNHVIGKESLGVPSLSLVEMSTGELWYSVGKAGKGGRYSITFRHIPKENIPIDMQSLSNSTIKQINQNRILTKNTRITEMSTKLQQALDKAEYSTYKQFFELIGTPEGFNTEQEALQFLSDKQDVKDITC